MTGFLLPMNNYQDPDLDPAIRIQANIRHDREPHVVSMWRRAAYNGRFNYPPEPKLKRHLRRFIDEHGKIHLTAE